MVQTSNNHVDESEPDQEDTISGEESNNGLGRKFSGYFRSGRFVIQVLLFALFGVGFYFLFQALDLGNEFNLLIIPLALVLAILIEWGLRALLSVLIAELSTQKWSPLKQCEFGRRVVVLKYGKIIDIRGDGLYMMWPGEEVGQTIDVRQRPEDVLIEGIQNKDNLVIGVLASIPWHITDLYKTLMNLRDYNRSVQEWCQRALGDVVGTTTLDDLNFDRHNQEFKVLEYLKQFEENSGIVFDYVMIQRVRPPIEMEESLTRAAQERANQEQAIIKAETEVAVVSQYMMAAAQYSPNDEIRQREIAYELRRTSLVTSAQTGMLMVDIGNSNVDNENGRRRRQTMPIPVPVPAANKPNSNDSSSEEDQLPQQNSENSV